MSTLPEQTGFISQACMFPLDFKCWYNRKTLLITGPGFCYFFWDKLRWMSCHWCTVWAFCPSSIFFSSPDQTLTPPICNQCLEGKKPEEKRRSCQGVTLLALWCCALCVDWCSLVLKCIICFRRVFPQCCYWTGDNSLGHVAVDGSSRTQYVPSGSPGSCFF